MDKMIAFCGLVCTECPAYLATQANDENKAKETAEMWSRQFHTEVKVEDVWCDGCLVKGKKCAHCAECEIRACGRGKNLSNCSECDEFACELLEGFFKMVPEARKVLEDLRAAR